MHDSPTTARDDLHLRLGLPTFPTNCANIRNKTRQMEPFRRELATVGLQRTNAVLCRLFAKLRGFGGVLIARTSVAKPTSWRHSVGSLRP